jgi:hypothetical protein
MSRDRFYSNPGGVAAIHPSEEGVVSIIDCQDGSPPFVVVQVGRVQVYLTETQADAVAHGLEAAFHSRGFHCRHENWELEARKHLARLAGN